jgi:small neutral amino acid transporter SnatA (MarC family)
MTKMSTRIAGSIASVLIAASMMQTATAGERTTKHRAAATTNEQIRNANASAAPFYAGGDDLAGLRNRGMSAPAGR